MLPDQLVIKYENGENASFAHEEEMNKNGKFILKDKYTHKLCLNINDEDMDSAWRIYNLGKVARNEQDLLAAGGFLNEASVSFCKTYQLTKQQSDDIYSYSSEEWWRAVCYFAKQCQSPKILSLYNVFDTISRDAIPLKSKCKEYILAVIGKRAIDKIKHYLR